MATLATGDRWLLSSSDDAETTLPTLPRGPEAVEEFLLSPPILMPPPSSWFEDPQEDLRDSDKAPYALAHAENHDDDGRGEAVVKASSSDLHGTTSTSGTLLELPSPPRALPPSPPAASLQKHLFTINNSTTTSGITSSTRAAALVLAAVGETAPSPSWREFSMQVLPRAARELLSSSLQRICYTARLSYAHSRWHRRYSDLGNNTGGYFRSLSSSSGGLGPRLGPGTGAAVAGQCHNDTGDGDDRDNEGQSLSEHPPLLPPFSSLPWVERQLVKEWRTYCGNDEGTAGDAQAEQQGQVSDSEEADFDRARTLVPAPAQRPAWQKADSCYTCNKTFGPTRLRHHCRLCGHSVCQLHSSNSHKLPHLGYDADVPERVCDTCKRLLMEHNLAERVAWRLARCRDYAEGTLAPYFETGVESIEDIALRITQAALAMAKSIPLGVQATVAVETVDVLRKYGLNGIYTVMLRQEFLAAAELLRKALGINRTAWPLSVHELTAALFYALAQHRALRGLNPDREHIIHRLRDPMNVATAKYNKPPDESGQTVHDTPLAAAYRSVERTSSSVCDPVPDETLGSLLFYAPMALNFIYAEKEVDMQLLAAQQGWRLLYAYLEQEAPGYDRPASALFIHEKQKIACVTVRGTVSIHDIITDIRQIPVPFPESDHERVLYGNDDDGWTKVLKGQGVAVWGMAAAAVNLYREHIDSLLYFARRGYRIRLTGHSLGGGVATLVGVLVQRDLVKQPDLCSKFETDGKAGAPLKVYAYGTPSCVDSKLATLVESFVTTVVLHDDAIPRLTPASCRGLLKHLLHIRETWVKKHLPQDIIAIRERAKTVWAPRWRGSFTLPSSSSSIQWYCRKQIQLGKSKLLSVKEKLVGLDRTRSDPSVLEAPHADDSIEPVVELVEHNNLVGETCEDCYEDETEPRLLMDYMGGIDSKTPGVIVDGDAFFDADGSLLETGDDDGDAALDHAIEEGMLSESSHVFAAREGGRPPVVTEEDDASYTQGGDDSRGAVVLDETPLPQMYIPGRIVHIYSHRGVYKAAFVPRTFRDLRRISMAGNMLSDHKCKAYYEALLEVRTVRDADEGPPLWTAFDDDDTCSCCASRFTWASTSDSEAQQARDKHNCRSCGTLVCDPCSQNRIPVPSIGLSLPSRVCDRCYNDMDGIRANRSRMTSSFVDDTTNRGAVPPNRLDSHAKPVRYRERRSAVVDDLASRVHTSPLTCSGLERDQQGYKVTLFAG